MLQAPQFDPVALRLGPLAIHWYGLMYLLAFALVYLLGRYRINRGQGGNLTAKDLEDLIFYSVLGVVLGGRLGYVLFYKPGYYLSHPLEIAFLWEGGMSFHGGLIGVILVMLLFARKKGVSFFTISDFIAPLIPLGLGAGRMGNFINGELWGRPSTVSWAMVFPQSGDSLPRHPSQLYELGLEGLVLFVILWWFSSKPRPTGQVSALFLMGYGAFRFLVEFTREPDNFLGLLAGGMSMGQWLSLPMFLAGLAVFVFTAKRSSRQP
ncbi:prolipoprotein diacylglyceryl transferase [Bordetella holmesii]|uniref:Phosphatidylglycerol--prolipoprotein diacylglyceryl transferase n=2 Tax=Bordetella holmesii TaxID=35814 RepID=A0A158M2M3_9BORD|nr:prolipoprotein diacylglyceryl transferase [Bordetella holmesii]AHV92975.1 prolipoprotein diacylglyceryl transferase [Bordetella holmesii ATCC 51541]AIT26789.1 prolipoprotein diacylglyceryl transferase [Bordetella holmesii 44057]EWM43154.1 prolipoprotein diacylglyceryl transferase [Bordetella holmesii 41130]EWM47376.1 prolipoprotein diacylglyceryl transferase [Bordetella holmesii 35009]AMD45736.1 prolipoprotein diacylglyceryl transferase [Bordetella holmesii H558]